ncbi:hypothetical protein [Rhodospirillaceae bacterium SYSU D60014]|uniref:hypothetical protein n=1 Tax=Virgifigura deserti TaxID=2268457 RepID=UPI0013C53472
MLAVIATLGLTGCAGTPSTIHHARTDTSYRVTDLSYVAGRGDMLTEIVGNPFGSPQPEFEAAVTSYMEGSHFGPRLRFNPTRSDATVEPYRVRMIFNGPRASNGSVVCGGGPAAVEPPKGTSGAIGDVRLLAAFCRGSSPLTFLSAELEDISGADDPAFRDFIQLATARLFPPQNPELRPDRCMPPC